ncbi:MAG: S41 family peptidase [Bacteroidaceae bacterium]|nr:S41 family peptidase [Bacteroidaceae bacterium]
MMTRVLTLILLFLCYILELSAQTTGNPTSTSYYQWPIEGGKAGEGTLYRPQDYIGNEHNFDKLIIGAKPGTNVVSPCDGVITHVTMRYYLSLNKSFSYSSWKGKFEDIIEQNKESMAKRMQDAKYLSYMYFIKSNDGRTIHISGLRTDTPFATGQKVKKGEVLGQVHYCYRKIPQPGICLTIDRGGKPDDPMAPFGLKTTFIPPVNQKPKAILTRAEAIADYRQMASSVKEIYPSLEDFMTEEEYDTFVEEEIAKIPENITLKEFAYLIMNFNRKVHDSHMWFDYGIPLDNDGTISPVMFARVNDKVRIIVTTDEYKAYTGREITHINGKHVDTLYMEIVPRTSMIYDVQVESVVEQELASPFTNHLYYKGDKDAFKAKKATLTFSDGEELTVPLMEFNQNTISQFDRKTMENWFVSQYMVYRKGNWETMKSNDSTACMRLYNFELMETEVDSMLVFLDLLEKKGYKNLIIDLRGNPGGNPDVEYKLVDALMDEPIKREGGYMKVNMQTIKSPTLNYPSGTVMFEDYKEIPGHKGFYKISDPDENTPSDTIKALYTGRVYVLINANSASASTDFAGIMKHNARGYVIGRETKTAYHTMNASKFAEIGLPNSHFKCHIPMVRIVSDEFVSDDFPYGRGVIPHLTIPFTYEEMTNNGEMIYNKALELIRDGIYLEEPEEVIEVVDEPNRVNISYIVIGILLVSLTLYFGLKKRK